MKRKTPPGRAPGWHPVPVLAGTLCLLASAIGLSAVSGFAEEPVAAAPGVVRVLATSYPVYVHTLNVLQDVKGVTVTCLTPPGAGCLHDYQLTPADATRIAGADVVVANGAGMESFMDEARRQAPKAKVVTASDGVALITDASGCPNPHVWLSLTNAARQVRAIAAGLAEADPARAVAYRANAEAYAARLEALGRTFAEGLKAISGREIVTFHEAFPYLAEDLGLKVAAVIEREPGAEPSARELAETIRLIRARKIKAIFVEPQYPTDVALTIARETGVKVLVLDPAVTGPANDPDAFVAIMKRNLDVLSEALKP